MGWDRKPEPYKVLLPLQSHTLQQFVYLLFDFILVSFVRSCIMKWTTYSWKIKINKRSQKKPYLLIIGINFFSLPLFIIIIFLLFALFHIFLAAGREKEKGDHCRLNVIHCSMLLFSHCRASISAEKLNAF